MIEQSRLPLRFGIHASINQLTTWLLTGTVLDGGVTQGAFTLASLLFWICAVSLLWWHESHASRFDQFFLRWGLLAFVLFGTVLLRPVIEWWTWLFVVLYPVLAALIVLPALYLVIRAFGLRSPFDDAQPPSGE